MYLPLTKYLAILVPAWLKIQTVCTYKSNRIPFQKPCFHYIELQHIYNTECFNSLIW